MTSNFKWHRPMSRSGSKVIWNTFTSLNGQPKLNSRSAIWTRMNGWKGLNWSAIERSDLAIHRDHGANRKQTGFLSIWILLDQLFIDQDMMSRVEQKEREDLYQDRVDAFLSGIRKWQSQEEAKIKQKSRDEQQYETSKIINEAKEHDQENFARMEKSIEVEYKIKKSRKVNEMRLSKMKLRFEMIEKVQNEIRQTLSQVRQDQNQYLKLLEELILQGMIKMLEEKIEVKCLPQDVQIVKKAMGRATSKFHEICELRTELHLATEKLPNSDIGGIIMTSFNGKIVCNNTLKVRLEYAVQLSLPEVRSVLFEGGVQNTVQL